MTKHRSAGPLLPSLAPFTSAPDPDPRGQHLQAMGFDVGALGRRSKFPAHHTDACRITSQ